MRPLPYWMSALTGLAVLLSALSIHALFTGPAWMADTFTVIIMLAATGTLARMPLFRLPRFVPAAVAAVAAACTISALATPDTVLGFVPTPRALDDLAVLWDAGMDDIAQSQAPTMASSGLQLIVLVWISLVAVLADIACQDLRMPALTGLPLLAVYVVVGIFHPDGITAWQFIPAALGYLGVVVVGTAVRSRQAPRVVWRTTAVGACTVVLAAFLPLPQPTEAPLDVYQQGLGNRTVINPFLDLRRDLVRHGNPTVLTYRTKDKTPPPLRIMADTRFNGKVWSPGTVDLKAEHLSDDGLPNPPGLGSDVQTRYRTMHVKVLSLHQDFLPAPYPAVKTVAGDNWIYDPKTLAIAGRRPTTPETTYSVTYLKLAPSPAQLTDSGESADARSALLNVPRALPAIVRKTAHRIAGSRTNKYEIATALQRYFRSDRFRYTLKAPSNGGNDALAAFLKEKSGYCVQFASAMAVMARVLGIPSRVAVGFLPGTRQKDGSWAVTLSDAHAWPELYFNGVGWIRFEPTPSARTGSAPDWTTSNVESLGNRNSLDVPDPQVTAQSEPQRLPQRAPTPPAAAAPEHRSTPQSGRAGAGLLTGSAGLVALLLLMTPRTVKSIRLAIMRSRTPSRIEAAWATVLTESMDYSSAFGVSVADPALTPRQIAARLSEIAPDGDTDIEILRAAVESERYGSGDAEPIPTVRAASNRLVRAIGASASARRRYVVRLFPRSAFRGVWPGNVSRANRDGDPSAARVSS